MRYTGRLVKGNGPAVSYDGVEASPYETAGPDVVGENRPWGCYWTADALACAAIAALTASATLCVEGATSVESCARAGADEGDAASGAGAADMLAGAGALRLPLE